MAVLGKLSQQVQDLTSLRELAELINNPKIIIKAHEEARNQMSLTDEEANKLAAAKDFISKGAEMEKNFKSRLDKLDQDIAAHEKDKADASIVFENESKKLASLAKEQAAIAKEHMEIEKKLAADSKALKEAAITQEKKFQEQNKKIEVIAAQNEKDKAFNAAETNRLAILRQKLETKMAKFQEAAAI